jgi:acetyl-CoA carboxylase biotin carboxyl carrier protein
MDVEEIEALIAAFAASDLAAMEIARGGWRLRLVRGADGAVARQETAAVRSAPPTPPPPERVQDGPAGTFEIRAPIGGIVQLAPVPGAPPFAALGQQVESGQVVAIVEAMKVLNEVRSPGRGRVEAVLVDSGVEVEAGRPLLRLGPP